MRFAGRGPAAGSGGPVGVDANVALVELYVDVALDEGSHVHLGEASG